MKSIWSRWWTVLSSGLSAALIIGGFVAGGWKAMEAWEIWVLALAPVAWSLMNVGTRSEADKWRRLYEAEKQRRQAMWS